MGMGFIKPDDDVVYSTAEEDMWDDELQSRREFELRTGVKYDTKQITEKIYGDNPLDVERSEIKREEQIVDAKQSSELLNTHVISFYKGRINITDEKSTSTIKELAEQLTDIKLHFKKEFDRAWIKEFGEEEETL